jgi:hypothetical protein
VKCKGVKWTEHVEPNRGTKNTCKILVAKVHLKNPLGRMKRRLILRLFNYVLSTIICNVKRDRYLIMISEEVRLLWPTLRYSPRIRLVRLKDTTKDQARRDFHSDEKSDTDPVEMKLVQYKDRWLNHVSWMKDIRYPEQLFDCRPIGKCRPGRPLKRLQNG